MKIDENCNSYMKVVKRMLSNGANAPDQYKAPPMPETKPPRQETAYTRVLKNPFYKRCIEIKRSKDNMWDVFIDGSWACSRGAWENAAEEVSKIMKEISDYE